MFKLFRRTQLNRIIAALALAAVLSGAAILPASAQSGAPPPLPPGVSRTTLRVKFHDGTPIPAGGPALPASVAAQVSRVRAQFGQGKSRLDGLRARGKQRTGRDLPDLSLWYTLTLRPGADAALIVQTLQALPEVESVNGAALPMPLPTADFSGGQGYLGSLGAAAAWAYDAAGAGSNVTIYDVEYSWNTTHEDLSKVAAAPVLTDPGDTAVDPFFDNNHGTGVMGELVADNNGFGVTGIAYNASVVLVPANTANRFYDPANAIVLAALDGSPGDIILIEQQNYVCGTSLFGPSEYYPDVWQAIRTATDNGITVVEAAGNGDNFTVGQNLDARECQGVFKPSHDSGAIIVGAGQSDLYPLPRAKEGFSSYGKRVNVQAWGDSVVTTGYGDMDYSEIDPNKFYTSFFSGTSSASPMVAGLVADMQSLAIALRGEPLSPEAIRSVLVRTGAKQMGVAKQHIGPQVRAGAAISAIALARPTGKAARSPFATSGVARLTWKGLRYFEDPYLVRVDNNADFLSPEFITHTRKSSAKVGGLPYGRYFWQVAALDVDGGSFQVTALASPKNGVVIRDTTPAFKWRKVPGAGSYQLIVGTGWDSVADQVLSPVIDVSGIGKTSYTPETPLAAGTDYFWQVITAGGQKMPAWKFSER